jgi:tRNA (mo5U34)-methyltransferase
MRSYYPILPHFPHRLNAWKRQPERVNLTRENGHVVAFPGLRMYPHSFYMRHYQVLSLAHARQKYQRTSIVDHPWVPQVDAHSFQLPHAAELRTYIGDDQLDPSNPRRYHYLDLHAQATPDYHAVAIPAGSWGILGDHVTMLVQQRQTHLDTLHKREQAYHSLHDAYEATKQMLQEATTYAQSLEADRVRLHQALHDAAKYAASLEADRARLQHMLMDADRTAARPVADLHNAQVPARPSLEKQWTPSEVQQLIASVPGWYHQIELAQGVVTPGINKSAESLSRLGLPSDCRGLRVLDLGTRDGFFAFELEQRGATVVAVDYIAREQTGFDVAARIKGFRGQYLHKNVYDLRAAEIGTFDIVLFLGLLYHLPDPLGALQLVRSLCHGQLYLETFVLDEYGCLPGEQPALDAPLPASDRPIMRFLPGNSLNNDPTNYWAPNLTCLGLMLSENMFEVCTQQQYGNRAIVTSRITYDSRSDHYMRLARGQKT